MDSTLVAILLQAGVAGVFCILFIAGVVFPRSVVTDLKEENKLLRSQLAEARKTAEEAANAMRANALLLEAFREGQKSIIQGGSPGQGGEA